MVRPVFGKCLRLLVHVAAVVPLDCEQSLIFLCKVTAREPRETRALAREEKISFPLVIITSWFAIALDEVRTRRI